MEKVINAVHGIVYWGGLIAIEYLMMAMGRGYTNTREVTKMEKSKIKIKKMDYAPKKAKAQKKLIKSIITKITGGLQWK